MMDEIVSEDMLPKVQRRSSLMFQEELIEQMKKLKPGQQLRLANAFGHVTNEEKNRVAYNIRKHWLSVRDERPSIFFDSNNVPNLRIKGKRT